MHQQRCHPAAPCPGRRSCSVQTRRAKEVGQLGVLGRGWGNYRLSDFPGALLASFCVRVIRSGRQRRCVVSPRVSRRGARSFKGQNGAWGGGGMGLLQSPETNTFLLFLPNFFWGSVEISSLFHRGCLNKTLKSLLVRPQIGFSF